MSVPPKAVSVTMDGELDGWMPEPGYYGEMDPRGPTRIVVSVPVEDLPRIHEALIRVLQPSLGFLYRQKVDRRDPKPQSAPPRDFVGLELTADAVLQALTDAATLAYHDARHEMWIRGGLAEQVVLDEDGILYCYPDDPAFRDALDGEGIPEAQLQNLSERDYVKHWFHAECDTQEDALIAALGLQEVPHRRG